MELTALEQRYFEQLEKESATNPMLRISAAAQFLQKFLEDAFTRDDVFYGDEMCYIIASCTGVAVIKISIETEKNYNDSFEQSADNQRTPIVTVTSKMGNFFVGDTINDYLYTLRLSVWNILTSVYKQNDGGRDIPDLQYIVERNAKKIGTKEARIWNDMHNPYEEIKNAYQTCGILIDKLTPYKLKNNEVYSVFALALANTIVKVEGSFELNYHNCQW